MFVLAASNLPWDLDPALLRRLDKRILVPAPNKEARKAMMQKLLANHVHNLQDEEFEECSASTNGYSGADIKLLCKEAAMAPVRSILKRLEETELHAGSSSSSRSQNSSSAQKGLNVQVLLEKNPISISDFRNSLECTKSTTCTKLSKRYEEWASSYGSA